MRETELPKILVDFDGVINDEQPDPGYVMGKPVNGCINALKELAGKYRIIVFTSRNNSNGHVDEWLRHFQVPYDAVVNTKVDADYYIDDKAIRFENWFDTLNFIRKNDEQSNS